MTESQPFQISKNVLTRQTHHYLLMYVMKSRLSSQTWTRKQIQYYLSLRIFLISSSQLPDLTKIPNTDSQAQPFVSRTKPNSESQSQSDSTSNHLLTFETLPAEQNIDTHSNEFRASQSSKKSKTTKHLTLFTGSCILKNVETRFLDQNMRVKHFKNAKIDTLKDALTYQSTRRLCYM